MYEGSASTFVSSVKLLLDDFIEETGQLVGRARAGHERLGVVTVKVDLLCGVLLRDCGAALVNGQATPVSLQILILIDTY
jgi:hypothetical protein